MGYHSCGDQLPWSGLAPNGRRHGDKDPQRPVRPAAGLPDQEDVDGRGFRLRSSCCMEHSSLQRFGPGGVHLSPKVTSGAKPVPAPAVIAVSPVVEPEDVASPETTSPIVATPVTLPPREVKKGCISTPPAKLFSKLQLKCAVDWSACAWKTWNIRKCSHIRRCCVRGGGAKCVICGGR